jgi:hypothetical protein
MAKISNEVSGDITKNEATGSRSNSEKQIKNITG